MVQQAWQTAGIRTLPLSSPGRAREELVRLVLAGAKTATVTLLADYADDGEHLETPGEYLALADERSELVGVVRVTSVHIVAFRDVPWELMQGEGEEYTWPGHWRDVHRRFWRETGQREVTEDTPIVCIEFTLCPRQ